MVTVTCINRECGVDFGIPEHIERQARRDSERLIKCPNGHAFRYTDSEPEKLRKRIAELEATLERCKSAAERAEQWAGREQHRARYWKGIATRFKNRKAR